MNNDNNKCVIIIDEKLPLGIIANTAAILGITLGKSIPDIAGRDINDSEGKLHCGIIRIPVPILKSSDDTITELRHMLYNSEYSELTVVDFSDLAQSCKTYDEYILKMESTPSEELKYLGIAIFGSKKKINKLTGNMPLLR